LDALTIDVGPAPGNIAVVLELPDATPDEGPTIAGVLADRVRKLPALGRAIHRDGRRLYWVNRAPQPDRHIRVLDVSGSDPLVHAGHLLTARLDLATPPWAMNLLVHDHGVSVVFVAHHVLTDGLHGLAMLASLADAHGDGGSPAADPAATSQPRQPGASIEHGAERRQRRRLPRLAPRTSLNQPTGPDRVITTHDIPLEDLRTAAHRAGVTINDLLLVAISQAVAGELHRRGEHPRELRVWVPVAAPTAPGRAASDEGGNALGVMLVPVDVGAAVPDRLVQVSAYTKRRKPGARQPTNLRAAHLISQASGRLGLAWFMNQHQRIGNTSLSTMRGPAAELRLAGHPIRRIVPAASRAANVGVSFIALSYAGTMTISIVHDPAQLPAPSALLADLADALEELGS
jgi:hypothetical protein